ncbi:protein THYLAKOID FORMATION1, chloroplastic [Senna tora]|uniref:Protein THYLAKOID FORMATION1, chloroplastic n=1 Tax=Senna tora TaxID=362788 RepID=A0A834WHL7_9FABA|nr:protein THYLAKOID FORMATION1, chloroplastic [Senna tora]
MAAVTSLSFSALTQCSERKLSVSSTRFLGSNSNAFRLRMNFSYHGVILPFPNSAPKMVIQCMSSQTQTDESKSFSNGQYSTLLPIRQDIATVSETKFNFLKAYKRPIPSIYNTVLQELLVQQHLMRYKRSYRYDPVFALGFVTVYDQLMEGYPSDEDRDAIFKAYIEALKEDPNQYRVDAQKLEEWARAQNPTSLVEFSSREGEVEGLLKDIAERAGGKGNFSYSRFFAVGLFRLLELVNATEPTILEKLCAALNIDKKSVDRDLDVYRNLLSKLVQAKELLKEYVDREKKKREERTESQKANEAITKCLGLH